MSKTPVSVVNTKKPAAIETRTAVERPHKNLTQIQEEVADIASDILLNGGARQDLELLLGALARHHYRNMSFSRGRLESGSLSAAQLDASAREYATTIREDWYWDLSKHWPERKAEAEDSERASAARPVTEMVRANIRASAQAHFEQFLTDTDGIEPIWLLNEVLENFNSGRDLGEAIWDAMDRAEIYVKVPYEHKDRIEEFVASLEKEEPDYNSAVSSSVAFTA